VHNETLFDLCGITESVSSRKKDRIIVQIENDVAASWKEKKQRLKLSSCVMFMLNRMYTRCASGSSDDKNAIRMNDPYLSELPSVWIIYAL
jgi:hypothetical protein